MNSLIFFYFLLALRQSDFIKQIIMDLILDCVAARQEENVAAVFTCPTIIIIGVLYTRSK